MNMDREQLRQRLEFYRDLGVEQIYRRTKLAAPDNIAAVRNDARQPDIIVPSLEPQNETLDAIRADIGDCRRCRLCEQRKTIVFGSGSETARLVFVGEGPGADEDEQGLPFVGRAGQLLTQMIDNTASREGIPIRRKDVYICNVVKCRPPENRTPLPDEMETCGQFLYRQLMALAAESDMRARLNCDESAAESKARNHQAAR